MYAIIEDGGKQYWVRQGDTIFVERRDLPDGATHVQFDRVLMLGEGAAAKIGDPAIPAAKVSAKLHGEIKGPKLVIQKFRRRKGYHKKKGHRQKYLKVTVEQISG
ncbi:MAG: 50S ribosomal protein L21 [Phycisphaerae bacterium]